MIINCKIKNYKLFTMALTVLLSSGCRASAERPYEIYNTVKAAKLDGAFQRGWLPLWLPKDAYTIHEYHDLDTNIRAISFSVTNPDNFTWPHQCKSVSNVPESYIRTKLFPKHVHEMPNQKDCGDLFAVMDNEGIIHAWRN